MLRKLTEKEQGMAIAKYCSLDVQKAVSEICAMDADKAILPDDINIVLDEEKVPAESGYCMLENGGSYISVKTVLPNVTKEMLQWMIAWQGLDPLNYVAINPETHHSAAISDINEAKIMNSFLSLEQKCEGIYIYSIDKIGDDLEGLITSYLSPMDQGFCMDKHSKEDVLTIGGYVLSQKHNETDPQKKALAEMITVVRDTENGVAVHTHVWGGYKLLRREAKRFDVNGIQPTEERTKLLANHIANEWAQIAEVLPKLYQMRDDSRLGMR